MQSGNYRWLGMVWRMAETVGQEGDKVVQEGRSQVGQGFGQCDIDRGQLLKNSEPFNGMIQFIFYKDHSSEGQNRQAQKLEDQ